MTTKPKQAHTPTIDVYTVLSMAEFALNAYSNQGTRQHQKSVLEKTRSLIEYAPELLQACKDAEYFIRNSAEQYSVQQQAKQLNVLTDLRLAIAKAESN